MPKKFRIHSPAPMVFVYEVEAETAEEALEKYNRDPSSPEWVPVYDYGGETATGEPEVRED